MLKFNLNFLLKLAADEKNCVDDEDDESDRNKENKEENGNDERNDDKLQNEAATKIQSSYRGYAVRQKYPKSSFKTDVKDSGMVYELISVVVHSKLLDKLLLS